MAGREYKVIITGTMGAGKTTAIRAISDISMISTEAANTDLLASAKATTTVALDYGELQLDGGDRVRIYGTPGQQRFSFMWEILAKGALGLVLLIDNSSERPLEDLGTFLDAFSELTRKAAAVVGVTHCDAGSGPTMGDYYEVLAERGLALPVFSIDGREREDVLLLLDALLTSIEAAS